MKAAQPQMASADMQATISMLQEELEATNREVMLLTLELEQRVAGRTADLAHANQKLLKEIVERLRAEAEIKQLNKDLRSRAELLEAANQELEAFSYSVSHDLRNPLARVLGYASVLQESVGAELDDKDRKYLDKICDAGRKMTALIDDLLRLSRSSHGELAWAMVDLNQLVSSVISEFEHEAQLRNLVWKVQPLPVAMGDHSLLRQVFINLISNALKYSRPRDPAEIEIGASEQAQDEWIVFVRDNGVGFDSKHADKLFGVFQRLHADREFEGTGLGLANVRRIVLRHGGKVWAEGRLGEGATFYFSLPKERRIEPV